MDSELRPKITIYSIGAVFLAAILSLGLFVVLGALLFGCAHIEPYRGSSTATTPTSREEFVRWDDQDAGRIIKRLYVDNPLSTPVRVKLDCDTPAFLYVEVPARSTREEEIFDVIGNNPETAPDACRVVSYEALR